MSIVNPCDFAHCENAATFHVRVPLLPGADSYTLDVCDEHLKVARANGAEVEEWFDRPRIDERAA